MNKLYFGAALVSLLASAPALAQVGPPLGSFPNPAQGVGNIQQRVGNVGSAPNPAQGVGNILRR